MTRCRQIFVLGWATATLLASAGPAGGQQQAESRPIVAVRMTAPADGAAVEIAAENAPVASLRTGELENTPLGDAFRAKGSGGGYLQTLAALAGVAGLIIAVRLLGRRRGAMGRAARGGAMEVIARTPVGPKQQLLLVRLGRRVVLVGAGPNGFAALGEVCDAQEVNELIQAAQGASFGESVKKHLGMMAGLTRGETPATQTSETPGPLEDHGAGDTPRAQGTLRELAGRMRSRLGEEEVA